MSGFLLDTNVISELVNAKPEVKVTSWVESTNESMLYLSVLTLGEIRKGIASLPDASRKSAAKGSASLLSCTTFTMFTTFTLI